MIIRHPVQTRNQILERKMFFLGFCKKEMTTPIFVRSFYMKLQLTESKLIFWLISHRYELDFWNIKSKKSRCKQNSCQNFDECTLERYYDPTEPDSRSDQEFYIFCRRNWTQYLERMRWNCFLNISQLVLVNKIEIKYVKPAIE